MVVKDLSLGYEDTYQARIEETRSMITLATLLDVLDQGVDDGVNYRSVMDSAYAIAQRANPAGTPSQSPSVSCVASVIRSNVKIMIYNVIEFSVTNLIQAIYDKIKDEDCGYIEVSEELRTIWHKSNMRRLNDPNANNHTAEQISRELVDHAIANTALRFSVKYSIPGGNLDGTMILNLFKDHGISIHPANGNYREDELKDIKDRRNDLAHGSVSFAEAGGQVTTSELSQIVEHVDSFLNQLHIDVSSYLESRRYRVRAGEADQV